MKSSISSTHASLISSCKPNHPRTEHRPELSTLKTNESTNAHRPPRHPTQCTTAPDHITLHRTAQHRTASIVAPEKPHRDTSFILYHTTNGTTSQP